MLKPEDSDIDLSSIIIASGKLIYTTNAIESLNYTLRKVTKNRNTFPDDDSVYKIMYLAINNISKKWTMPVRNWGVIINQLSIMFGDRVKL